MSAHATEFTADPTGLKIGIADAKGALDPEQRDEAIHIVLELAKHAQRLADVSAVEFTEECKDYSCRYRIELK